MYVLLSLLHVYIRMLQCGHVTVILLAYNILEIMIDIADVYNG